MEHRSVEEHVAGLRVAVEAFAAEAARAGLEAKVPTVSAWTVRKLLAHQGMVHRWARANLRREDNHPQTWNAEGQAVDDPVGWLVEGAEALIATIEEVPEDVAAMVFLKDAPRPRLFWARRQCHETTIHAVDALAARLGRPPGTGHTSVTGDSVIDWISDAVALDGIDEVLTGFITRGASRFAGVSPIRVLVQPSGHERSWSVLIRDGAAVTTRLSAEGHPPAEGHNADAEAFDDVTLSGAPVWLYLRLWNRAAPDVVNDPSGFLDIWRDKVRVRWS